MTAVNKNKRKRWCDAIKAGSAFTALPMAIMASKPPGAKAIKVDGRGMAVNHEATLANMTVVKVATKSTMSAIFK